MIVDKVLDFGLKAGTVVVVMAFLLLELTVLAKVQVTWYGIW